MIVLNTTSEVLRVVTSAAIDLSCHVSGMDKLADGTGVPTTFNQNTVVSTATTTTVASAPGSGVERTVKTAGFRNKHASTSQAVTVQHYDGTTAADLISVTLPAGWHVQYDEGTGWKVMDALGRVVTNTSENGSAAAVNALNTVVLASDVTNNNASANTIADVTGLSFSVTADETYWFRAHIWYTAAAGTTGSRWSVSGPSSPTRLGYKSSYSLTTTTQTLNQGLSAYDLPAASNATSPLTTTGGNTAIVEGIITPSANGTVVIRFASEVSSSAIVAKAGSLLQWMRVL